MTSPLQGNGVMVAILVDPGYSMKERFAFAIHFLFLKQRVTSMLDYATLLGKILMMCGLTLTLMNEDGEPPTPDTMIDPNQPIYRSFDTWIKQKRNSIELVRSCFQIVEDFWPS